MQRYDPRVIPPEDNPSLTDFNSSTIMNHGTGDDLSATHPQDESSFDPGLNAAARDLAGGC